MAFKVKTPFIELYEELSEFYAIDIDVSEKIIHLNEAFSSTPKQTSAVVDLSTCREIISSKYDSHVGAYEANCVTTVNGQLSRIEVRVFVLKREDGEIKFLGRKCNRGTGYTTPGGGFDLADITPIATAKRELHEELGISLSNIQESSIHTFKQHGVRRGGSSWVRQYVENPEDHWTGYYQYYVTAEYGGDSGNSNPAEIGQYTWLPISVFEDATDKCGQLMLQIINGHKWSTNLTTDDTDLDEAFDSEDIWGEAAKTIDGIVRYFAPDLHTLRMIVETGKVKQSQIVERDPNIERGTKQSVKRPFVSFSHQLYSHAYRAARWRYGVAIDAEKLKQTIPSPEANITDNFKHESRNIYVYGAAKLSDGSAVIITSYGDFTINWDHKTRDLIKQHKGVDLKENTFYNQIKDVFYNELKKDCTSDVEVIKKAMRSTAKEKVVEGFVTTSTVFQSYGYQLVKLDKLVPGLLEYIQNYTYLDEGELRIWLDFLNGEEFLDISSCITNLVLPSDYLEDPFSDEEDLKWLQDYITKNNIEPYIYDASRTPKRGMPGGGPSKYKKTDIADYFNQITETPDALLQFIRTKLYPRAAKTAKFDFWKFYTEAIAAETSAEKAEVAKNAKYNHKAFLDKAAELGFSNKSIKYFVKTGANFEPSNL